MSDVLICLATYNEFRNIRPIYEHIRQVLPDVNILFVDDNSPDGTGNEVDRLVQDDPLVRVIHRPCRLGVGSAHKAGIRYAFENGYRYLLTMDCDMAHSPEDIPQFLEFGRSYDVVVGSRFMMESSLLGWNAYRKFLTHLGHWLTRHLLKMPFDATGAMRCYRLATIPSCFPDQVTSDGYPFFFESLHLLFLNGKAIKEVPIRLPARIYGESKMRYSDVVTGFIHLLRHAWRAHVAPPMLSEILPSAGEMSDSAAWNAYWAAKADKGEQSNKAYEFIAGLYRGLIIKPALDRYLNANFTIGAKLLHAGAGSGMVDVSAAERFDLTACDFSSTALECYRAEIGPHAGLVGGDIFHLPFADNSFDGIYNLGVMEHFRPDDINKILAEFKRVVRTNGRIVLFWPHARSPASLALKAIHFVLNRILRRDVQLHPPEPTLMRHREQARSILAAAGFDLEGYSFNAVDAYTHAVIVGRPNANEGA